MQQEECPICDKIFDYKTKFAPEFCNECQAVENVNGNRFRNTSFEELVRYYVEAEKENKNLKSLNEELREQLNGFVDEIQYVADSDDF